MKVNSAHWRGLGMTEMNKKLKKYLKKENPVVFVGTTTDLMKKEGSASESESEKKKSGFSSGFSSGFGSGV